MATDSTSHFRILKDIARDLSGEVTFPTCMDAALMVRNTLKDPQVSLDQVAHVLSAEPLISSKLLRIANSAAYNPSGQPISGLKAAINRLGFEAVRTISLAVTMEQMLKSRHLAGFHPVSKKTWEHALHVAAIARALARRIGRVNPDEAMLAGMVHDIGVFYLLYRAAEYPEYRENFEAVMGLIRGWHSSIGESLLHALCLPEHIIEAVRDHETSGNIQAPARLKDVLHFAIILARKDTQWVWQMDKTPVNAATAAADRERYADLLEEAREDIAQLQAALAA